MSSRASDSGSRTSAKCWPIKVTRNARAKRMRLRVDPRSGTVLLTIPPRASERRALAWAELQRDWIEAAVEIVGAAEPLKPGCIVPLHGKDHILTWQPNAPRTVRIEKGRILTGG